MTGLFRRWSRRRRVEAAPATVVPDCHAVAAVLQAYLDGALHADEVPMVEAHLAHCARCGIEAEVHRRIVASLALLHRPVDPDAVARLSSFADHLSRS